ncbi:MAG: hypothetical protein NUV75_11765, partial [Gallionella sp.]|nr:hypothetical protein [Gallionella sp.]
DMDVMGGRHPCRERVTSTSRKGDTAMSPNTSRTVINHHRNKSVDKNAREPLTQAGNLALMELKRLSGKGGER